MYIVLLTEQCLIDIPIFSHQPVQTVRVDGIETCHAFVLFVFPQVLRARNLLEDGDLQVLLKITAVAVKVCVQLGTIWTQLCVRTVTVESNIDWTSGLSHTDDVMFGAAARIDGTNSVRWTTLHPTFTISFVVGDGSGIVHVLFEGRL